MLVSSDVQKLFFFNFEQILNIIIIFLTKKQVGIDTWKFWFFSFSVIFDDPKIEYALFWEEMPLEVFESLKHIHNDQDQSFNKKKVQNN